jgi:hypothetical protein
MTEDQEYFSKLKTSKLLILFVDLTSDIFELSTALRSFDRVKHSGTDIDKNEEIKDSVFKMKTELSEHIFQLRQQHEFLDKLISQRK